jgi:hypothetical protein
MMLVDPGPDLLVRGMDPRIRIRTKILWIRNTAFRSFGFRFCVNKNCKKYVEKTNKSNFFDKKIAFWTNMKDYGTKLQVKPPALKSMNFFLLSLDHFGLPASGYFDVGSGTLTQFNPGPKH